MPLDDKAADFVICNSVIEHVPLDKRAGLASEVRRVGRHFIVQTPSPAFPLELYFGLPFIHWLPRSLARRIVPISPFALLSSADVQTYFDETRLLWVDELQGHFPEGKIKTERFLGIPKSNLVFG